MHLRITDVSFVVVYTALCLPNTSQGSTTRVPNGGNDTLSSVSAGSNSLSSRIVSTPSPMMASSSTTTLTSPSSGNTPSPPITTFHSSENTTFQPAMTSTSANTTLQPTMTSSLGITTLPPSTAFPLGSTMLPPITISPSSGKTNLHVPPTMISPSKENTTFNLTMTSSSLENTTLQPMTTPPSTENTALQNITASPSSGISTLNPTMTSSLENSSIPTKTTSSTTIATTTIGHRKIYIYDSEVNVNLAIIVNGTFNKSLEDVQSDAYKNLSVTFNVSLTEYYNEILNGTFVRIANLTFFMGSIGCTADVILKTPKTSTERTGIINKLTNGSLLPQCIADLPVNINKTIGSVFSVLDGDSSLFPTAQCSLHEEGKWLPDDWPSCIDKCQKKENKNRCGNHGSCGTNSAGEVKCFCNSTKTSAYEGAFCNISISKTTPTPITSPPEKFTKKDIIGIAAGSGGALVVIFVIALGCVCRKLNRAKKGKHLDNYTDDDKKVLQRENSRIENVPNLRTRYTNPAYHSDQEDMQMQRFGPEGRNAGYHYDYEEENPYRTIDEPDVGNVVIYQPSRRQSAARVDQPDRDTYSMIESEASYKIKRPILDRNAPYN